MELNKIEQIGKVFVNWSVEYFSETNTLTINSESLHPQEGDQIFYDGSELVVQRNSARITEDMSQWLLFGWVANNIFNYIDHKDSE